MSEIEHPRECDECGETTYAFERCHVCGDVPWHDDEGGIEA